MFDKSFSDANVAFLDLGVPGRKTNGKSVVKIGKNIFGCVTFSLL
jgi:hypothetical protein